MLTKKKTPKKGEVVQQAKPKIVTQYPEGTGIYTNYAAEQSTRTEPSQQGKGDDHHDKQENN